MFFQYNQLTRPHGLASRNRSLQTTLPVIISPSISAAACRTRSSVSNRRSSIAAITQKKHDSSRLLSQKIESFSKLFKQQIHAAAAAAEKVQRTKNEMKTQRSRESESDRKRVLYIYIYIPAHWLHRASRVAAPHGMYLSSRDISLAVH